MEVASPLTFAHGSTGTKRHFPGSPGFVAVETTNRSPFAALPDSSDEYGSQRAFKRRRFHVADESMEGDVENTQNHTFLRGGFPSFPQHGKHLSSSVFSQSMSRVIRSFVEMARLIPLVGLWPRPVG